MGELGGVQPGGVQPGGMQSGSMQPGGMQSGGMQSAKIDAEHHMHIPSCFHIRDLADSEDILVSVLSCFVCIFALAAVSSDLTWRNAFSSSSLLLLLALLGMINCLYFCQSDFQLD